MQGHYAEHDPSTEKAAPLFERMRAEGKDAEMFVYPGTEHAFYNDHRQDVHDPEASALAWERTLAFFREHLSQ